MKIFILLISILLISCGGLEYIKIEAKPSEWQEVNTSSQMNVSSETKINKKTELTENIRDSNSPIPQPPFLNEHRTILAGDPVQFEIIGGEVWVFPALNTMGEFAEKLKLVNDPLNPNVPIPEQHIDVPGRDRRNTTAITLGFSMLSPTTGGNLLTPYGAFYLRQQNQTDTRHIRAVITGLVNYISFRDSTWNDVGLEVLFDWENSCIPVATGEVVSGVNAQYMEVEQGYLQPGIGIGWNKQITNLICGYNRKDFDNYWRVQLLYETGYWYTEKGDSDSSKITLPPDTDFHQLHLRIRFSAITRNLLELPHCGIACGADVWMGRRSHWSDYHLGEIFRFDREHTQDYLKATAYLGIAMGIPFLSEQHRLISFAHVGYLPSGHWDRWSGLRIGGGPLLSESEDLARANFPGATFSQFIAEKYFLANVEYRYEFTSFFYIHLRGTWMWGKFGMLEHEHQLLKDHGLAVSVAITTGFIWKTMLYVEYSVDDGFIRRGTSGYSVFVSLSKEL